MARSDGTTAIAATVEGEAAELPRSLEELESLLQDVRQRIHRHRDTIDMRLALRIEERIAHLVSPRSSPETSSRAEAPAAGPRPDGALRGADGWRSTKPVRRVCLRA